MRILALETSCDETAAAVVDDGRRVIANVIASQTPVHRLYHGVVPEIASRCHIEYALPVVGEALRMAGAGPEGQGVDAVAVTRGPGLIGSLLVGVETAKALALAWNRPLIAVHHTLGHLHSVFCEIPDGASRTLEVHGEDGPDDSPRDAWRDTHDEAASERRRVAGGGEEECAAPFGFPFLGLVVSGGHSSLVRVDGPRRVRTLGNTLDDAPGEAYDKVAKCLGLGYPGGPEIDRRAAAGDPAAFNLPRPVLHSHGADFSFSGLKTAVVQTVRDQGGADRLLESEACTADLCASFQAAVIDVLLTKAERALKKERLRRLAVVGGVACNSGLRAAALERLRGAHLLFPAPILCTDNAAMIAAAAHGLEPLARDDALRLDARAGWDLDGALSAV